MPDIYTMTSLVFMQEQNIVNNIRQLHEIIEQYDKVKKPGLIL